MSPPPFCCGAWAKPPTASSRIVAAAAALIRVMTLPFHDGGRYVPDRFVVPVR